VALEDEETWLRRHVVRLRTMLRFAKGSAHRSGLERVYRRRRGAAGRGGENAARAARSANDLSGTENNVLRFHT